MEREIKLKTYMLAGWLCGVRDDKNNRVKR
jgi:hypothetical protein